MKNYLSLCLFTRDENRYLKEWIDYHRRVGVEHFHIIDNGSRTPVRETLAGYPDVTVYDCDYEGVGKQMRAYNDLVPQVADGTKWLGIIDTDEFLVPKSESDLRTLLAGYEPYPALCVNWLVFGSNGHEAMPDGGVLRNFTKRSENTYGPNVHVKTIMQPFLFRGAPDPHGFVYGYGQAVNENGRVVEGPFSNNSTEKVQINHYYLRSRQEFAEKIARGRGDGAGRRSMEEFDAANLECNLVEDTFALRYL